MILESSLGFPDEESMSCEDGLVENHYYRDLRWVGWDDYDRWVADEQAILDYSGDLHTDEADDFFVDHDNEVWRLDLDPGVATTVAALAAIGCCPVTSCNGWAGHFETHPLVLVWCEQGHVDLMQKAIAHIGGFIELTGLDFGVLVHTPLDVSFMQEFAAALSHIVRGGSESEPPA